MKYRYIYEKYGEIYCTDELTRDHLIAVKNGQSDFLIDVVDGKWFSAENNEWKDIYERGNNG